MVYCKFFETVSLKSRLLAPSPSVPMCLPLSQHKRDRSYDRVCIPAPGLYAYFDYMLVLFLLCLSNNNSDISFEG